MRRFVGTSLVLLGALLASRGASSQEPSFALSFDAPAGVTGDAGAVVQYTATGRLTTTGLGDTDPGAQGWSLSMSSEGGAIVAATTAGTIAAPVADGGLWDGGFDKTETTSGAGNEGAVSAIVLSFTLPVTLPPAGTVDVIKLTVEATVPAPVTDDQGDPACEPLNSKVLYTNGRRGSGQPVDNKITWKGTTYLPTLGDATTSVCPKVVKPLVLSVDVRSPAAEKSGDACPASWNSEVAPGTGLVDVAAGVVLTSNLPGPDGAQGWSVSVLTETCFNVNGADTAGTDVDLFFSGGFKKTEVVDPAKNSGQQGAVSAIVLSFTEKKELPPTGDALVLKVTGQIDASGIAGPGDTTPPCVVAPTDPSSPGLRGAGQPVKTAITVAGNTRNPGVCGAAISLSGARQGRFVRGNSNDDSKNDIADAVWIINELFRNGPPTVCRDAADANNDGMVDTSDALYLIGYQFQGQAAPPAPFDGCGVDPEGDEDGLTCDESQRDC